MEIVFFEELLLLLLLVLVLLVLLLLLLLELVEGSLKDGELGIRKTGEKI